MEMLHHPAGLRKTAHINHTLLKRLHPHPKGIYTMATLDRTIKTEFLSEFTGALA